MVRALLTISLAIGLFGAAAGGFERGSPQQLPRPPQAPLGTGAIAGQVVDGRSGSPLADAVVTLIGRGMPAQRVLSDPSGRFSVPNLPSSAFIVNASKAGFAGGAAGAVRAQQPPRPITLANGQRIEDLTLRLWKLGVVTGTVTGDGGEPVIGLEMHAWRRSLLGGRWIWMPTATAPTDDRGVYRINSLAPGDYVIVARPASDPETPLLLSLLSSNPELGFDILAGAMTTNRKGPAADGTLRNYGMTFFPGSVVVSRATVMTIGAGDERTAVDVRLAPQRPVRVSGTVTGGAAALEGLTVRLVPADADGARVPIEAASTVCEPDGKFEFPAVTPGRYVVSVLEVPPPPPQLPQQPPLPTGPTWWAGVPVVVAANAIANVTVALHQGATISGTIMGAGGASWPRAQAGQMTLRLDRVDPPLAGAPATWRVTVDAGRTFRAAGVPPGRYLLRVANPPRGWTTQSALVAGRDILDAPLTVTSTDVTTVLTLTDRAPATLTGTVHDDSGAATSDSAIAIFPIDRELWTDSGPSARRLKLSRPDQAGSYSIGGLVTGDYFVIAVRDDLPVDWPDPKRLAQLAAKASRVSVTGPSQTLDLKVVVR